jgi:hypothetical protein
LDFALDFVVGQEGFANLVVLLLAVVACDFALVFFAFAATGVSGGVAAAAAAAAASSESAGGEHRFFTAAHCMHASAIMPALTPLLPYSQFIHHQEKWILHI